MLTVICVWGIERYAHKATDGFAVVNIVSPDYEKGVAASLPDGVSKILDQPFRYLNCGAQSYVFASQDGKYVLKFFKFQHMRILPWLEKFPLSKRLQEKRARKEAIYSQAMESCKIAYEELKEETGLLYAHIAPSDFLKQKIVIFDKIGVKQTIDLDKVEFVLQHRAKLAYDQIDEWMAKGDIGKARKGIADLIDLAKRRCLKGLFDKDPDFSTNFGFIGSKAVEIDIGRFSYDETRYDKAVMEDELFRITRELKNWLESHHPLLSREVKV